MVPTTADARLDASVATGGDLCGVTAFTNRCESHKSRRAYIAGEQGVQKGAEFETISSRIPSERA